jgi:GlpG protein
MRKLADAADQGQARAWVDHLLLHDVDAQVRPEGGTEVWVVDDDDLPAAREHLDGFDAGAAAKLAREAAKVRRRREREAQAHVQRYQDIGKRWMGVSTGAGLLTTFLIVVSIVGHLVRWLSDGAVDPMWNITIDHFDSIEPLGRVRQGEVWRLVTPMFLHFGLLHLGFNMLWLDRLGRQIEHNHGLLTMLVLVITAQVVGGLGQYWVTGPSFGGMSGVNYALFGFVWMNDRYNRHHRYAISGASTVLLMVWFVACATGMLGPIANIGHAGGLVVGLMFGLPSYIRHVAAKGTRPEVEEGTWAAVHLTGFRRFRRRVLDPYVPLWFLLLAGIVIAAERPGASGGSSGWSGIAACDAYVVRVTQCLEHLDGREDSHEMQALLESMERGFAGMTEATGPDELAVHCAAALEQFEASGAQLGCSSRASD